MLSFRKDEGFFILVWYLILLLDILNSLEGHNSLLSWSVIVRCELSTPYPSDRESGVFNRLPVDSFVFSSFSIFLEPSVCCLFFHLSALSHLHLIPGLPVFHALPTYQLQRLKPINIGYRVSRRGISPRDLLHTVAAE